MVLVVQRSSEKNASILDIYLIIEVVELNITHFAEDFELGLGQ
jgi:hypothetical protein